MEFDEIKDALNALKRGESIIVVDDEDRENEKVRADKVYSSR